MALFRVMSLTSIMLIFSQTVYGSGVVGKVWDIEEKDPIQLINATLLSMERTGELEEHNQEIKRRVKESIERPISLGIPKAIENFEYFYDPSITIAEDLKGYDGRIIHEVGTKVNPLDYVTLPYEVLFFDGDDSEQLQWALDYSEAANIKPKLVLAGGSPVLLEERIGKDFYFDQAGLITAQLGITHIPAIMMQKEDMLSIKEIKLS